MLTWADIVQALASAASVLITLVGFFLVIRQIKQADMSRRVDAHADLYQHQHQIHTFFIENADLRPYFYEDRTPPTSEPRLPKIKIIAEMIADFLEHIYLQLPALPSDVRPGWEVYMSQLYRQSPALREHLEARRAWYTPELLRLISVGASET